MIGVNGGHQLNILIFEVGMIQTIQALGIDLKVVSTVSVHPLLVAPTSIRYTDATRSSFNQTAGGTVLTPGGRALRNVTLEGTFGSESRGLGPYIGNGAIRFTRFYKEVVRMGEALTQDEVDDNVDWLNGTPFIKLFLTTYDDANTNFFINFYDFWHDRAFQCLVQRFDHDRAFMKGGAVGLTHYTMSLQEIGPIVEGGLGESIISLLMDGLTLWNDINNVIDSYDLATIIEAFTGPVAIALSMAEGTLEAIRSNLDAATALFGSSLPPESALPSALSSFGAECESLASSMEAISGTVEASAPAPAAPATTMSWDDPRALDLDAWDTVASMRDLADAARFQLCAGLFFGMSLTDYQNFLASSGDASWRGPEFGGSIDYIVGEYDTAGAIEARFGVDWQRVLAFNGLTPLEALTEGTRIRIPVRRYYGTQGRNAIPVLDSHAGEAAWGRDVAMEIGVDALGDLLLVEGEDCLTQGVQVLSEELATSLIKPLQSIPESVRGSWLTKKISAAMKSDPRISSVVSVTTEESDRGIALRVVAQAINGSTIRTGVRV
ncbi:MAG: LysM peptidoglycan-binding domain-containing protein [Thermoleophilia bacterium]